MSRERPPWRVWARIRRRVLERDGYRCQHCGRAGRLEIDHRVRVEDGGGDEPENLQALCSACHIAKTRRENTQEMRVEWREYLVQFDTRLLTVRPRRY